MPEASPIQPLPPGSGTHAWRDAALLALLWIAGTLLLVCLRPGYGFPPFELLDSWFYTSYQWDLRNQLADFGPTYYESRLSWILPGALLHHLLPPLAAGLAYKLVISAIFTFACGTIVYRAAGMPAAVLAVTLSLFAPQFVVALHADYIDTPVIVYAALALAGITRARDSRHWYAWVFMAGCALAGMLISNLSSVGAPGMGLAIFHLIWLRWGFRRQLACLGLYLLAMVLVTTGIGFIHMRLGGAFYFLKPQVAMMLYFHGVKTNPWSASNWLWIYGANWLVLPAAVLLWGLHRSIASLGRTCDHTRLVQALTGGLLVSLSWAFYVETKGVGVLLYYYYATYHLCLALPLLAALCWPAPGPRRNWSLPMVLAGVLAAYCFTGNPPALWSALAPLHRLLPTPEAMPWVVAASLLLAGLIGHTLHRPAWLRALFRPEVLVIGLYACSMSMGFRGYEISDRLRERYMLIYRTYWQLAREFPRGSYLFWVHPKERNGVSLASTKLWGYRLITDKGFPELGSTYYTDKTVIIPCPVGEADATFATAVSLFSNWSISLIKHRVITVRGKAGLGYDLLCFSMEKLPLDPDRLPPGTKPPTLLMAFLADGPHAFAKSLTTTLSNPDPRYGFTQQDGVPRFNRASPDDHVATPFHACPPDPAGQERVLSVVTQMPAEGACVCLIQDEGGRTIGRFELHRAGRDVHRVILPPETRQLRVVFESREQSCTPLPTHVLVYALQP